MEKEIIIFENIEFYKIPNVECYYVSKCGKVYSNKRGGRILKSNLDSSGYESLMLMINNKKPKTINVHRLVAITFLNLPVDDNLCNTTKLTVNHINEIKTDNRLENLEVVTQRENRLHSSKSELCIKGVTLNISSNKTNPFQSQITINNKFINLGYYQTAEIAGKIFQIALQNVNLFDGDRKKFRELIKSKTLKYVKVCE